MKGFSDLAWPTDIEITAQGRLLIVAYDDGFAARISAEKLRVESPSAEVQGHSAAEKKIVVGKENVAIVEAEPVGNYAVRLIFDDGHSTGLYTWEYLRKLAGG